MKNIVVFFGTKGVGKDTCFEILQKVAFFANQKTVTKVSFADALKESVYFLFANAIGDKERIYGAIDKKEEPIEGWKIPQNVKEACGFKEEFWSGRRLLQWFGTDVCRNVYDNVWIDTFINTIKRDEESVDIYAVTDCRFKNEYDALLSLKEKFNVLFVKVHRDTGDNEFSNHASEIDIQGFKHDIRLINNGSIEELEINIKQLVNEYLKYK